MGEVNEMREKDLKSDGVDRIIKKERRQLDAAKEARAVVERTFSSITSAGNDRSFAQLVRSKLNDRKLARRFEEQATEGILSNKAIPIYDPDNPNRFKR